MSYISVDLGKSTDPTAIAVVERMDLYRPYQGVEFHHLRVRHLERVALGTPYPLVINRIQTIVSHPDLAGSCALAVDGTGVGAPVVDMLRSARLGCDLTSVIITGGDSQTRTGSTHNLPKRDLLAAVQVALESGQLKLSRNMKQRSALLRELKDVQSTANPTGHERLGADGFGQHDDFVIALALACWRAKRPKNSFGTQRLL